MNRKTSAIGNSRIAETDNPTRRIMLRGLLAAGCGLLIPSVLQGCEAGKEADTAGVDAPPMADPTSAGQPVAEPEKVSKASVQYQTQPQGGQQCSNCLYFIVDSNACRKVEGDISPVGWCVIWSSGELSRGDRHNGKPATLLA